jgi:hypothetical protein
MGSDTVSKLKVPFLLPLVHAAELPSARCDQADAVSNPVEKRLGLIVGLRFALIMEITAAFCAYEIWRFFRG